MRNKFQNIIFKVFGIGILTLMFSTGCNSNRLTRSEWFNLMEDLRLRKNSLELEKSYLKSVLTDSLLIDSLRIELKKCEEEIEELKSKDTTNIDEFDF